MNIYQIIPNPRMSEDDPDYKFAVRLLKAPYSGIVIEFGTLKFAEQPNPDGTLDMDFSVEVLDSPKGIDLETIEKTPEFTKLTGDIILDILDKVFLDTQKEQVYLDDGAEEITIVEE